jgi:hypothetical protein
MTNSRNKGVSYERELSKLFEAELGVERPQRRLEQTREVDMGDLVLGDDLFMIEAKRYAASSGGWFRPEWWAQAKSAAAKHNMIPVLVYRYDRLPNRFVFPIFVIQPDYCVDDQFGWPTEGNAMSPVVVDQEVAMMVFREWLVI